MDAEIAWTDRAIRQLSAIGSRKVPAAASGASAKLRRVAG
jgi:hypothetical protein